MGEHKNTLFNTTQPMVCLKLNQKVLKLALRR